MSETWQAAYYSDLQSLWSLWVMPLAFLAWRAAVPVDPSRAVAPEAARFVAGVTLFFAFATMVDPASTGPLAKSEGIAGTWRATAILFFFVLLGDFRVLLLVAGVARPERSLGAQLAWAGRMTLIVPVLAGVTYFPAKALVPDLHGQILWMIYEAGFFSLCLVLSRRWLPTALGDDARSRPRRRYLRALFGFSAAYYALWLTADVFIVLAELDLGWAIRMVPNQLYYAFWVPFAYAAFFSGRFFHDAPTPAGTQDDPANAAR